MTNKFFFAQTKNKILFLFISLVIVLLLSNCSDDEATNNEAASTPVPTPTATINPAEPTPTKEPIEEVPLYDVPECITKEELIELKERNSDFVFWFYLPSETVQPFNYPVMQTPSDKFYYIDKDFDKNDSKAGTLFLHYQNNAETLNSHTVIFGHNQSDGSMFGNLLRYYQDENGRPLKDPTNDKFLKEHPYFYTYSEKETSVWKIFSIYETRKKVDYIRPEEAFNNDKDAYLSYIKHLQEESFFDIDVELKADDDVMTLSTCYRFNYEDGRLAVHAVRVQTTPTK